MVADPSGLLAGVTLFIVLGGSAAAATGLVQAGDIAPGAVTSRARPARPAATGRTVRTGRTEKGAEGPKGAPGTNGTVAPLSAKQGLTALPTRVPSTVVVELAVPAGGYVVMAKTQLFQTGAGDSVECLLKSGTTTLDQAAMKTLPALASVPASLQAVATTTGPSTTLSVQCSVAVANGTANYNSLIAIPTA
jgi:hypothetical protein